MCCSCVIPKITAITCSALTAIENGMIVYSSDTTPPYDYGTTAVYECDTGYEITSGDNSDKASCSGILNIISIIIIISILLALCDDITLTNGRVTYDPTSSPRLEGTTATHNCNSGYVLFGERERMCQSDRTWSGEIVTCNGKMMGKNHVFSLRFFNIAITCPPLADSPYGSNILLYKHFPILIWNTSNVHYHMPSWTGEERRK